MPIPVRQRFVVRANHRISDDCFALTLAPVAGDQLFSYQAGQWVMMHLLNEDGTTWKSAFSIASAPSSASDVFELAIKVYGDYTKRAQALEIGSEVEIQGPYGVFVYRPSASVFVCLSAGIGIVPLRSMILEAVKTDPARKIILLYTNSDGVSVAFREEFEALQQSHENFDVRFFTTKTNQKTGDIARRISIDDLREVIVDASDVDIATCGPNTFMAEMKLLCGEIGVDVKKQFHQESFGS